MKRTWKINLVLDDDVVDLRRGEISAAIEEAFSEIFVSLTLESVETPLKIRVIDQGDTLTEVMITDLDTGARWQAIYSNDVAFKNDLCLDQEYIRELENPRRREHQGEEP